MRSEDLDAVTRLLLDRLQRSFPIVSEPYRVLAEAMQITEQEVRERIGELKRRKLVRQISAIFNTGVLGYHSSLVAAAVPESDLERTVEVINGYPGVSHNYLRPGTFNLWYTIAVPPGQLLEEVVEELSRRAGGWTTLLLPALKTYKLAVVLDILEEDCSEEAANGTDLPLMQSPLNFEPSPENIDVVRCIQEDLPLVGRPFAVWAEQLGMTEAELLELVSEWLRVGFMRRFAAVLNHRQVGFSANGMVIWSCPAESIDECGRVLASHAEVSHCYQRPAYREWPYNLYAMVHGRTEEDSRKIAEKLSEAIHLHDYRILFSTREFKKVRLKLFWN